MLSSRFETISAGVRKIKSNISRLKNCHVKMGWILLSADV